MLVARIIFTSNLERHLPCPPLKVRGETVRAVLNAAFIDNPRLRGYILDDQGHLRKHVMVAVCGDIILDRASLSDPVAEDADVYVFQALSGG
jgi:molybdopterin synthase sulfur carrier subunit